MVNQVDSINIATSNAEIAVDTVAQHIDTASFLQSVNFNSTLSDIPINIIDNNWVFIFSLTGLILLAWVRNFSPIRFAMIFSSVFSFRQLESLVKERGVFHHGASIGLVIMTLLGGALFAYQINYLFLGELVINDNLPYVVILRFAIVLSVFWFLKVLVVKLIGVLFKAKYSAGLQLLNMFTINVVAGLTMLLIIPISIFTEQLFLTQINIAIVLVLYSYRIVRGFISGRKENRFSFVYIILYLCTLEIIPVILLMKFILPEYF
ncbi:MAG: DUF4271 domain-containing protein [Bacteroidota bacterium]|nr:DUF4271 domain-containing protein [Bacteroidota bacterium]